jgi:hypothetical protein
MKLYKNITLYVTLLIVSAIIAGGCGKKYLTPEPLSFYTPENTYNTSAGLLAAVEAAGKNMWYENQCLSSNVDNYNAQIFFSDIAVSGATDATNAKDWTATFTPDNVDVTNWYWGQVYAGIKYANTVITYIDVPKWDTTQTAQRAQRNSLLGQGLFWRAYYYYYLTNCYGDVPWVGSLSLTPKINYYSTSRTTILKQIRADLRYASNWVTDGGAKGLPTKGAVLHLLTKVDLALNNFNDAITDANQVINGGTYKLMTTRFGSGAADPTKNVIWDLHQPLNKSLLSNTEGLLMAINRENLVGNIGPDYWIRNEGPYWGHNIVTPNGNTGTSDAVGIAIDQNSAYGRGVAFARLQWYASHLIWGAGTNSTGDYRHAEGTWMRMTDFVYNSPALLTLKTPDPYYGKPLQEYSASGALLVSDTIRSWFDYPGYKVFVYDPNTATSTQYGGYSDAYIFRLAETYLLRAEANVWAGNQAAAAADINIVRARANAQPLAAGTITIGTILDERARELTFEEERKIEMTRMSYTFAQTGQTAPTGKTYSMATFSTSNFWYDWIMQKGDFYNKGVKTGLNINYTMSPYMVLWPVPTSALVGNTQGVINQNAGYSGTAGNVAPLTTIQ